MTETISCACTALRKASRAVARVYDAALAESGMTTAQFAILRNIARDGEAPLSRLAEALVMDRTSLYRAVAPLETRGWVAVRPGGGKTRLAALTRTGESVLKAAEPAWEDAQRCIAGSEQWAGLEAALSAVTALAQQHGGGRA